MVRARIPTQRATKKRATRRGLRPFPPRGGVRASCCVQRAKYAKIRFFWQHGIDLVVLNPAPWPRVVLAAKILQKYNKICILAYFTGCIFDVVLFFSCFFFHFWQSQPLCCPAGRQIFHLNLPSGGKYFAEKSQKVKF